MVSEDVIARVPMLMQLSGAARKEIAARSVLVSRNVGDRLWTTGDSPRGLLLLLEGYVRIVRSSDDGRRHLIHREGPGATLGEVPLFDGSPYPATAEAETPVNALLITADALEAAMAVDPALARELLSGLARRVRKLVERLDALIILDVRTRLARFLLASATDAPNRPFTLGMSQERLAEDLGTVREVVVRTLGRMRAQGLVKSHGRGRYSILDEHALEAVADPGGTVSS